MSFVRPTNGTRGIEYDWTTKRTATLDMEWTGSTNFEERPQFKDGFITEDIDEQQETKKAKGIPAPQQPTEQERMEHELTPCHTGAGALYAYKAKAEQTSSQSNAANRQRYKRRSLR